MAFRLAVSCAVIFIAWNFKYIDCNEYSPLPFRKKFEINTTWDGIAVNHDPVEITINEAVGNEVRVQVLAPFFDDPPPPGGIPGKPFPKLWEYEVVEIFFLGKDERYLEVELSPHGQHLLLFLNGARNAIKQQLPLKYEAKIIGKKWYGSANIPADYFPPGINLMNAYAIHGNDEDRVYESLYPTPTGKYQNPDFHRLEYFKSLDFEKILPSNGNSDLSWIWKEAIENSS
ncbi:UPF0462 protein C4orf33 homolog [Centruroides vittatus]|uniref:UPF0462 protein C4orf33 homolog n=1 Tax=Centruroides vittatus TaxID=120091 RepID=UPI00350FFB8D